MLLSYDITDLGSGGASVFWNAVGTVTGGTSGQAVPECAVSVGLKTAMRGRSFRGRVFVGPLSEGQITDGQVESAGLATMQAGWEQFLTDLGANSPAMQLVVASYLLEEANQVTSISAKSYVATQRRRLVRTRP